MIKSQKLDINEIAFIDEELFTCGELLGVPTQNSWLLEDKATPIRKLPAMALVVPKNPWAAG